MASDLSQVEAEIRGVLQRRGSRPRRLSLVSPLGERKGMRYAYRVDTDDHRILKARHFGTADEARRVYELRRGLDGAFAPALECCGAVLIEAWVEGEMLGMSEAEAWAQPAGVLLGRLHARPLAPGVSSACDTARWSEASSADLDLLEHAGVMSAARGESLAAAVRRGDPGRARVALIHKDFCAENMLVDSAGALHIIDTEQLAIEPVDFDLAWTWHRWPMSPAAWARFMVGYRSAAPLKPAAQAYWRIVTGLTLARVFLQRMPDRLDAQLDRLIRCLADAAERDASAP